MQRPREVWAWGMYDLANQSFQLLINTLLFGIYLKAVVDPARGARAWSLMIAVSMIVVVALSPLLGALADARAWKKEMLTATGFAASALTASLAFLGAGNLWIAAALYVVAAVCVGIGENFLGSFLPELAPPEKMGRVSAVGWTMSYIGALLLLGLTWLVVFTLNMQAPEQWRWLFIAGGLWFLAGMLPSVFILKERTPPAAPARAAGFVRAAVGQLRESIRQSARFAQLRRFFIAGFVYSMGVNTIIYFAGIIGSQLGFGIRELTLLALVMTLGAGAGAVFAARYQDRIGHRRTILIALAVWTASALGLAVLSIPPVNRAAFWFIAVGLGLGLGCIGTGSRALVGAFTPASKSGEFFGVWGLVYKLSAVVGPAAFALASARTGQTAALFLLSGFFIAGAALLLRVREREGVEAARAGESGGLIPPTTIPS